ncbi:MAG: hypothetical protein FWE56_05710 [Candidatus Bathyarchaeota archaeon]|nr:hypothetical protein [Candidatus Termiticorpusculum sp.]MCL2868863.1 hypothetical protein [Candidatus Termiticorpusculum sp.]
MSSSGNITIDLDVDASEIDVIIAQIKDALQQTEHLQSKVNKTLDEYKKAERNRQVEFGSFWQHVNDRNLGENQKWNELHGEKSFIYRFGRMVPGWRELQRATEASTQLMDYNLTGAAGLAILAYNLAKRNIEQFERLEAEQNNVRYEVKMQRQISQAQYIEWKREMERGMKESHHRALR